MIGRVRPDLRYARPRSVMNAVGECVCRAALRLVLTARGECAADHVDVGRDRLERVVGLREQQLVRRRGEVTAAGAELRHPEQVQVRLVADDEVLDAGHEPCDRRCVFRELAAGARVERRRAPVARIDRDDQAHAVELRRGRRVLQRDQLVAAQNRLARRPDRRHADRAEACNCGEVELRLRRERIELARLVLRRADEHAGAGARRRRDEDAEQQNGEEDVEARTHRAAYKNGSAIPAARAGEYSVSQTFCV